MGDIRYPANMPDVIAADNAIAQALSAIRVRTEELCGEAAYPDAKPGPVPNAARPGEGAYDIGRNDKTDLRQAAEEMRLLLGYLYPAQRDLWQVRETVPGNASPSTYPPSLPLPPVLSVRREGIRDEPPDSVSPLMRLVPRGAVKLHSARTTFLRHHHLADDVLVEPVRESLPFLKLHTSLQAANALPRGVVTLFDDYVHDSRCGFRTPYFHEYAPGGYLWPRIIFVGNNERLPWLGFDPLSVVMDTGDAKVSALT
jgi:hypothetical protein